MLNDQGYVHVYTGNGKGKSTAAFGLALRAFGAGLNIFIGQFVKGLHYSELDAFAQLSERITVRQYGQGCFIDKAPTNEDIRLARAGLDEITDIVRTGAHHLVILDEANIATFYQLFPVNALLQLIAGKPPHVELVLTGRYAAPEVIEAADLVTEMQELKHYYRQGIQARKGIEC